MKILKTYKADDTTKGTYKSDSPLIKEIKKNYELTEVVLAHDYTEAEYADLIRQYDVLLTMWNSPHVPNELADNPGNLKYICNITGELTGWIDSPIIESPHIIVTNWGDAPAFDVAEGAFALMQAVMKDIPLTIDHTQKGGIGASPQRRMTSLHFTRVCIYGLGVIGRKFVEFIRPYKPEIYAYDPYVKDMPEGVTRVDTLEELFSKAQIMVIHAALCEETMGSVTKELLSLLPDGAVFINTARGAIVDQGALFEELKTGRLRAGLDVTCTDEPSNKCHDWLSKDNPVRKLNNVITTGHLVSSHDSWGVNPDALDFASMNCLENLRRFSVGEPLKFVMDTVRYKRST